MARWCALVAAAVVILTADASAFAQTALYACSGDTATAERVGVTLCNAGPTDALTSRVEDDNLQLRDGALIVELDESGVSASAGLHPGDVIYRVGGVDVANAGLAIDRLNAIGSTSDTVVNFLRGGRPYRVKLRRE